MQKRPERYRKRRAYLSKLSSSLVLSILLHAALFVIPISLVYLIQRETPNVFRVQLVQGAETGALRPDQSAPNPVQGPPPEEKPKGTPDAVPPPEPKKPPEPEKKPEPKKEPEKKPEPKKEPEKKPEPKKEPEKKPEPKKEPEKKPEPKKEPEKKPEPKKEPVKKPEPKKEPEKKPVVLDEPDDSPADEDMEPLESVEPVEYGTPGVEDGVEGLEEIHVAQNVGELTQGSNVEAADFPSALSYWATLVKRKVDKNWRTPPGLSLDASEMKVRVGFWVNRNGEVIDTPVVVDGALDSALRLSCIQAIKEALPLPPFPDGFSEPEQYITYVFTVSR